jgi:hypothetical protein
MKPAVFAWAAACCALASGLAAALVQDPASDQATVFIYYQPGEGPKTFAADVAIDGRPAVHLRRGVVFKTLLQPGSHEFLVTGLTGKRFTFRVDSGKVTYLRIVNRGKAVFELVTKDQGELDVTQGQLKPPDARDLRPRKK